MLHAYRHPVRVFEIGDLVILVGGDRSGQLLEVGLAEAEGIDCIVHAMPARSKFVR